MANITYTRPWMYPAQEAAIFNQSRFGVVEAGTKSGKTTACLIWMLEEALACTKGQHVWWGAPVYPQADIAFRRMKNGLSKDIYKSNDSDMTIKLAHGATMWFKSAEKPDNLYGEDVRAVVLDEASRMREQSWYAVRSTLTATRGKARLIGNIKGKKNWFYKLARRAQSGEKDFSYAMLTSMDAAVAGVLSVEEINDAKSQLPDHVFRELYMCEPSDEGQNPFGLESIKSCVSVLSTKKPLYFGIDLGKAVDYTVIIGLDEDGCVAYFERFQKPWAETVAFIHSMGNVAGYVDATGLGDPITEAIQRGSSNSLIGYRFSSQSKQKLMEGLALSISQRNIKFPSGVIQQELEDFEFEYSRTGVKYTAPQGLHDDCVCSLALAQMARIDRLYSDGSLIFI